MRFVGIDIASEEHVVAIVDETGGIVQKPTKVKEDALGHAKPTELLGGPEGALVAMEATGLRYDGVHKVGDELAQSIVAAAKVSVGAHHGHGYRVQVRHVCEELGLLRRQLKELDDDIRAVLEGHEVGKLLTTIDGIGPHTAARIVAEVGDPARFRDSGALAAYVGVAPATRQSGKRQGRAAGTTFGNARLRHWLWMPTLRAVKRNAWLKAFHSRLVAGGGPWKLAAIAAMRKLLVAVYAVARDRRPFIAQIEGATP